MCGCTSTNDTNDAVAFEYTDKIKNEIALPILRRELGEKLLTYYDASNPIIDHVCQEVWLLFNFDFRKLARNEEVLDPPYVIIALNPNSLAVIGVSKQPSYIVGPRPRCDVRITPPIVSP